MQAEQGVSGAGKAGRLMRAVFGVAKHLVVLAGVILVPPLVYELVSLTALRGNRPVLLIGALVWPLYLLWLGRRIRAPRLRFVFQQLVCVLTVIGAMSLLGSCAASSLLMACVVGLPLLAALLPLPGLFSPALRQSARFKADWRIASALGLLPALAFAALMWQARVACSGG